MLLTRDELMAWLAYDSTTGVFTWRKGKCAGKVAGTPHDKGYLTIRVNGKRFYAHRLAWLFVHGQWPSKTIDHRDGRRSHNAILNLRWATMSMNVVAGDHSSREPKSGYRGVQWKLPNKKWRATIRYLGKSLHLGYFTEKEQAAKAYDLAALRLFGEFAPHNLPRAA